LMTAAHEASRHVRAHLAESYHSHLHFVAPQRLKPRAKVSV
jgi:hypothetical protein